MGQGLKNRGCTRADVDERRAAVEEFSSTKLNAIASYTVDPESARSNIENMIGCIQIPLGFVGPLHVIGEYANGEFLVPMATTEGALLASVNRGCSLVNAGGGVYVRIVGDAMTRAPVFRTKGVSHSLEAIKWITENIDAVREAAEATTGHGKLIGLETFPNGRNLFLRFSFHTADAMGMNMCTIATEAAARLIEKETGAVMISVSGNMCTDKKPAAINMISGRGKTVIADCTIPAYAVKERMHTTVEAVVDTNYRKNLVGSAMAGSLGQNAHAANMLAAMFIATGQDPAQVVEGSMTSTLCEEVAGDLYISVRIPSLEIGTVGGGTKLPTQAEALEIMGCRGTGKSRKLGEIMAAAVLAGELSTLGAQAAGHLGKAHAKLGR